METNLLDLNLNPSPTPWHKIWRWPGWAWAALFDVLILMLGLLLHFGWRGDLVAGYGHYYEWLAGGTAWAMSIQQ